MDGDDQRFVFRDLPATSHIEHLGAAMGVDLVVARVDVFLAGCSGDAIDVACGARVHRNAGLGDEDQEARRELQLVRELFGAQAWRVARGVEQLDPQIRPPLILLVEEGLANGEVLDPFDHLDPIARSSLGTQHDLEAAVLVDLEVVQVRLREGSPGASSLSPVEDVAPEGESDVGGITPVSGDAIAAPVVEDAEVVAHVRVVDDELPIGVLLDEEDGVERIVLFDDPFERDRSEAGRPPEAFGPIGVRSGVIGFADDLEDLLLSLDPGALGRREPRVHARTQHQRRAVCKGERPGPVGCPVPASPRSLSRGRRERTRRSRRRGRGLPRP